MILPNPAYPEIRYVCQNMRQKSEEDIFGASFDSVDQFTKFISTVKGVQWVGYSDNLPAAIIGAYPMHAGVWALYGFGTDAWRDIWREVTRTARRDMMKAVTDAGAHRAQCVSPANHKDTHAWLRMLGATLETPMPKYGKGGQDYVMFAWIKETEDVRI